MMDHLLTALGLMLQWQNLVFAILGMAVGLVFGALPGLNGNVAIGLLVPFTFYLNPIVAIVALMAIGKGANFGGAVPAVLLNLPGTPAATFTAIDGHQLTRKGQPKKAMQMALWGSTVGDLLSDVVLLFVAAPLAAFALMIGPPEYAAIVFFSLLVIGTMVGASPIKGLVAAALGLLFGTVGRDLFTMDERFTFGLAHLDEGIPALPLFMGLLVVSEIMLQLRREHYQPEKIDDKALRLGDGGPSLTRAELMSNMPTILKGTGIGTLIGAAPGLGATLGAFLSYTEAKRSAPSDDPVGKGSLRGIAAAEAGNSATNGSNLIPLVTLGIPGNLEAALILGAFMIHGITPGPFLMQNQGPMLYAIFLSLILSNVLLLAMGFWFIRLARYALVVDRRLLLCVVLFLACVGSYAVSRQLFDVGLMFLFGALGYAMRRLGFTPIPMIIAFVLGPLLEDGLRRSLSLSGGSLGIFFQRPITIAVLLLATLAIILLVRRTLAERRLLEPD
jgi:putative tricarboxylic transport membrane protein